MEEWVNACINIIETSKMEQKIKRELFWMSHFGPEVREVQWHQLFSKLNEDMGKEISKEEELQLRFIVNTFAAKNQSFKLVKARQLFLCIELFGEFEKCYKQLDRLCNWYQGSLTSVDSVNKLKEKPNGTFLIRLRRFSADSGLLALTYKENDEIKHVNIYKDPLSDYYFISPDDLLYSSIEEVVLGTVGSTPNSSQLIEDCAFDGFKKFISEYTKQIDNLKPLTSPKQENTGNQNLEISDKPKIAENVEHQEPKPENAPIKEDPKKVEQTEETTRTNQQEPEPEETDNQEEPTKTVEIVEHQPENRKEIHEEPIKTVENQPEPEETNNQEEPTKTVEIVEHQPEKQPEPEETGNQEINNQEEPTTVETVDKQEPEKIDSQEEPKQTVETAQQPEKQSEPEKTDNQEINNQEEPKQTVETVDKQEPEETNNQEEPTKTVEIVEQQPEKQPEPEEPEETDSQEEPTKTVETVNKTEPEEIDNQEEPKQTVKTAEIKENPKQQPENRKEIHEEPIKTLENQPELENSNTALEGDKNTKKKTQEEESFDDFNEIYNIILSQEQHYNKIENQEKENIDSLQNTETNLQDDSQNTSQPSSEPKQTETSQQENITPPVKEEPKNVVHEKISGDSVSSQKDEISDKDKPTDEFSFDFDFNIDFLEKDNPKNDSVTHGNDSSSTKNETTLPQKETNQKNTNHDPSPPKQQNSFEQQKEENSITTTQTETPENQENAEENAPQDIENVEKQQKEENTDTSPFTNVESLETKNENDSNENDTNSTDDNSSSKKQETSDEEYETRDSPPKQTIKERNQRTVSVPVKRIDTSQRNLNNNNFEQHNFISSSRSTEKMSGSGKYIANPKIPNIVDDSDDSDEEDNDPLFNKSDTKQKRKSGEFVFQKPTKIELFFKKRREEAEKSSNDKKAPFNPNSNGLENFGAPFKTLLKLSKGISKMQPKKNFKLVKKSVGVGAIKKMFENHERQKKMQISREDILLEEISDNNYGNSNNKYSNFAPQKVFSSSPPSTVDSSSRKSSNQEISSNNLDEPSNNNGSIISQEGVENALSFLAKLEDEKILTEDEVYQIENLITIKKDELLYAYCTTFKDQPERFASKARRHLKNENRKSK